MKYSSKLAILTMFIASLPALADVRLPAIFADHMVLQRNTPLNVWGTANAGEKVIVNLGKNSKTIIADQDGNWIVSMPSMSANERQSHKLTIIGNNKIVLKNILIGDVWMGSGQSNMEWQLKGTLRGKEFTTAANHPNIRLFHIPKTRAKKPAKDVKTTWKECTPENIPNFSAVLYHFGKKIHKEVGLPIGLINSSWGGSPIEPWTITKKSSGNMYNGMIAPITKFAVRGTIWYQGETNVIQKNGLAYNGKMKDLILGWRDAFNNHDMPFYFVQIAPWGNKRYADGQLPALWEAQVATLKIPHTGMIVTTDLVDNINDIHPRNKHDVGDRLARWALARDYRKKDVTYSGPLYKSMLIKGNEIQITFAHALAGLKSRDGKPLSEFTIAGTAGKFVPAKAVISGSTVIVSAKNISSPKHVRFGWHRSANPNLINTEGLPASPFQTNNWTGGTAE
jgi:sialate O-acetylesterase